MTQTNLEKDDRKGLLRSFDEADFAYLQMIKPSWMIDDKLENQLGQLAHLYLEGKVVWGCVVQANKMLWTHEDVYSCPAEVVYDTTGNSDTDTLEKVADDLYELKHTTPDDPTLVEYAKNITNERARTTAYDVPNAITTLDLQTASLFVWRLHLPNGILQRLVPILVSDTTDEIALLPAIFWHKDLYQQWLDNSCFQAEMYYGFRSYYKANPELYKSWMLDLDVQPNNTQISEIKIAVNYKSVMKSPVENQSSENSTLAGHFVAEHIFHCVDTNKGNQTSGNKYELIAFLCIGCLIMYFFLIDLGFAS